MEKDIKRYYSPTEVDDLYRKFTSLPFLKMCNFKFKDNVPKLDELGTSFKELAKSFYTCYFDQDFSVIQKSEGEDAKDVDVFDLPIVYSDNEDTHISLRDVKIMDEIYAVVFESIVMDKNNDIFTAIKYVHELGHALVERNITDTNLFDKEIIPILLELLFTYDIDTDLDNFIQGEDGLMHNKYNPESIYDGEEFNHNTLKEILKIRVNSIYIMEELYKKSTSEKDLITYPLYINSTIQALELFNTYLEGNDIILGDIDDVLNGKKKLERVS